MTCSMETFQNGGIPLVPTIHQIHAKTRLLETAMVTFEDPSKFHAARVEVAPILLHMQIQLCAVLLGDNECHEMSQ